MYFVVIVNNQSNVECWCIGVGHLDCQYRCRGCGRCLSNSYGKIIKQMSWTSFLLNWRKHEMYYFIHIKKIESKFYPTPLPLHVTLPCYDLYIYKEVQHMSKYKWSRSFIFIIHLNKSHCIIHKVRSVLFLYQGVWIPSFYSSP